MIDTQQKATISAVGMPLIDMFLPTVAELDAAEQLINAGIAQKGTHAMPDGQNDQRALTDALDNGLTKLNAARDAVTAVYAMVDEGKCAPGSKSDLNEEKAAEFAKHFHTIIDAAKANNRVAEWLALPEKKLLIRGVGGTAANKLHGLKSLRGDKAATHLIGIVGPEDTNENRQRVLQTLKTSGIDFHTQDIGLEAAPVSYIITPKDGRDRIVLKAPIGDVREKLADKEAAFTQAITRTNPKWLMIEGSDISDKKLGADAFGKIYPRDKMYPHKPDEKAPFHIAFALPTDAAVTKAGKLQSKLAEILSAKNTRVISGNETELMQWFFSDNPATEKGENPTNSRRFKHALDSLQRILNQKPGCPKPIAFISAGEHGAYAVTPSWIVHVPVKEKEANTSDSMYTPPAHLLPKAKSTIVNTLGGGDAFFAGAFATYLDFEPEKRTQPFSKEELDKMLKAGHALAGEVIKQKHTQVPQEKALAAVRGEVPRFGGLAAAVEQEQQQKQGVA